MPSLINVNLIEMRKLCNLPSDYIDDNFYPFKKEYPSK